MQAQYLGLGLLRRLTGHPQSVQGHLHIGTHLPRQPVGLQPRLPSVFKGMAPAHRAGVPHGQIPPSQCLQVFLRRLQILRTQAEACCEATGMQVFQWPAQMGL